MADAVYDARMQNSQLDSDLGTGFEACLIRLERDLKSLRSAAATVSDRGRAMIDRVKAIQAGLAVPQQEPAQKMDSSQLDVADRLNELTKFVECAWLAAYSVEDRGDVGGLSTVLDHAATGLRKLSREI